MNNGTLSQYHLNKAHPEKLQFQLYSLKEYRRKSGSKAAVPHSHSFYQIIFFHHAGGTHCIDFKSYEIQENTLFFVSKDQVHAFDNNLNVDGWLLHFNESFFTHHEVALFLKHSIIESLTNSCYVADFKTAVSLSNYITLMEQELENKHRFGHEETIRFLLKALLISMRRLHQKDETKLLKLSDHNELRLLQFKELIELHYKEGFTVTKYAEVLHISTKTLNTLTKKQLGKSPSQLINERVILEAKRLLKFTSLQISEIAFAIGFEDDSNFVKYFKRSVGISPKLFREQLND